MRKLNRSLLVVSILILSSFVISSSDVTSVNINGKNVVEKPASTTITNCIPDPYFTSVSDIVVNGSSGEFSSQYHQAANENDFNYMELDWQHAAGTSLEFRNQEDESLPYCYDFIYLYQEFDWPYNEMPEKAKFQVNISTVLTGSFDAEQYGMLMFKIYAWLIDSSGNWHQILKTYPPYYDTYREYLGNLNYLTLNGTWGGMIENSSGIQEDPKDIVKVAIGLAPTNHFLSYLSSEPWQDYDGSVAVRIKSTELWVYMDEEPDPSQMLSPIYNNTWSYSVREVFPDVPKEYENATVFFRDIISDSNGFAYVLCDCQSDYALKLNQSKYFSYQILLKYNAQLQLVWARNNENMTHGLGMTVSSGYIYTTGWKISENESEYHNLCLTKWSSNGDIIWQAEWCGMYAEDGTGIAVTSDNSIFVWAAYYDIVTETGFWKSLFLKFDSSGNLLWNKTDLEPIMPGWAELKSQPDGLYCWNTGYVVKRDFNCEPKWNISIIANAASFDEDGNIYITTAGPGDQPSYEENSWKAMISKWDSEGNEIWHTNYSLILPDHTPWIFTCRTIDVAPDGSLVALLHGMYGVYDYHMIKLDKDGQLLWDKIVGDENWPLYGAMEPRLEISSNGLAYLGFDYFGSAVTILTYIVGPYSLGPDLPYTVVVFGGIGATIAIIAAAIYIRKYR